MNSKTLSPQALAIIDQYLHFKVGAAVCSVPYFNNKTTRSHGALSALVGKGTPKEILDEVETLVFKNHVMLDSLESEGLKKLLSDRNIGIDCSALAYHTLDAESQSQEKGSLKKHLDFIQAKGLKGLIASKTRPARLVDVETFADNSNSDVIDLKNVVPGDMITMLDGSEDGERNHILVIHQIDYANEHPAVIYYTHAIAYPEDGLYGSGIKQGVIEIARPDGTLLDQIWKESGTVEAAARIFARAQKSRTELRRLKWL